jgi:hypothetical protein
MENARAQITFKREYFTGLQIPIQTLSSLSINL